jgi:hypothetical protein
MADIDYQFPDVTLLDEPPRHDAQTDEELLDNLLIASATGAGR